MEEGADGTLRAAGARGEGKDILHDGQKNGGPAKGEGGQDQRCQTVDSATDKLLVTLVSDQDPRKEHRIELQRKGQRESDQSQLT